MSKKNKAKIKITPKKVGFKRQPSIRGFIKFLGKTFIIAIFVIYLIAGAIGTVLWWKTIAHRSLDMNNLETRVMDYRLSNKNLQAIFTVNIQKLSRSKEVLEQLLPIMPKLESPFFFEVSRRYIAINQIDEALFWHMLGRFYARYDILRCVGIPDDRFFNSFVAQRTEQRLLYYIQETNTDNIKDIIIRVLAWDKDNSPDNKPNYFCALSKVYYQNDDISGEFKPKITWPIILESLRNEMKNSLEEPSKIKEQK